MVRIFKESGYAVNCQLRASRENQEVVIHGPVVIVTDNIDGAFVAVDAGDVAPDEMDLQLVQSRFKVEANVFNRVSTERKLHESRIKREHAVRGHQRDLVFFSQFGREYLRRYQPAKTAACN